MARPRTFDEADVVAAARDEFWSRGYAATSMDDLTTATGLGRGSLYGAFGDKHTLFLRALDGYCTAAIDEVRAELREPGLRAYDRLARHIRSTAASVAADSRRGCLMARSAAELAGSDDEIARTVERTLAAWRRELVDCIKAAQREGSIDPNENPQALATMLLAFLRGMEALGKGGVKPAQIKAAADEVLSLISVG
jgi:TetR/AcrR family transcriptional regulator, transcriptional repressor for nem operon